MGKYIKKINFENVNINERFVFRDNLCTKNSKTTALVDGKDEPIEINQDSRVFVVNEKR
jgi:hypothetical protein